MHLKEAINTIDKHISNLYIISEYDYNIGKSVAKNLNQLRNTIINLEGIEIIENEINNLMQTSIFKTRKNEEEISFSEDTYIKENINIIQNGFTLLKRMYEDLQFDDNDLYIKLPDIENFDDLGKLSSDLKKAIEIPVNEQGEGSIKVKSAEPGSIWLLVSLGALGAIKLVGAICWAAAVIRKRNAEAKIYEQHTRTLGLKNDMMEIFVNAQKEQLKNILESEAEQIINNHYSLNNPEVLERLKLSINTVADLIDRGAKLLPASDNGDIDKLFPNYNTLDLIESTTKMLKDNSN